MAVKEMVEFRATPAQWWRISLDK